MGDVWLVSLVESLAGIARLLSSRGPAAITRFVVTEWVYPVESAVARSDSHINAAYISYGAISQESMETSAPCLTHRHASVRVVASVLCRLPRAVSRSSSHFMLLSEAATTAIATAYPFRSLAVRGWTDAVVPAYDGEPPVSVSVSVYEFRHD